MESLFLAMFLACSAGILIFLVSVFRKRDTMAPGAQSHDDFLATVPDSPWPEAGAALGLDVQVDEPEVLLCRHVLQGEFQGRLVRLQSFDRKHAGQLGHPSAVRVGVQQGMPGLDLALSSGAKVQKVHGVPSLCFEGETFLGDGQHLGRSARPIRQDGPWIELDGRCDPADLKGWLERALQVFSELERAHYAPWVQAAEDHGLRLEWEREQRVPRLAGLVHGVGLRASWTQEGGARITLLCRPGSVSEKIADRVDRTVVVEQSKDGLVLTLTPGQVAELSTHLGAALSAFE